MKLFEILTKPHPKITKSTRPVSFYPPPPNWTEIGSGQQAVVYDVPNKPNNVVKIWQAFNGVEDPAYQFVRLALNHQNNPYFPKIYSVKQYPTMDEGLELAITMEKLERISHSDIPKIREMFGNVGNSNVPYVVGSALIKTFDRDSSRHNLRKTTQDKVLKRTLRLLEPLFKHYGSDMSLANIMVRPNTHPRQYVFIDPITYRI